MTVEISTRPPLDSWWWALAVKPPAPSITDIQSTILTTFEDDTLGKPWLSVVTIIISVDQYLLQPHYAPRRYVRRRCILTFSVLSDRRSSNMPTSSRPEEDHTNAGWYCFSNAGWYFTVLLPFSGPAGRWTWQHQTPVVVMGPPEVALVAVLVKPLE